MARPLRIEYPGAWYHVVNRGANHNYIFHSEINKKWFLYFLKESVDIFGIEVHSYCLMGNHYHLLIRTPYTNLSKAMRHLNGFYTQKFNKLEQRDGPIFRGRYKAILIQSELYLLQVSRYIHLNPIEARLCQFPHEYAWSRYNEYIKCSDFLVTQTAFILDEIGGLENYIEFLN